MNLIRLSFLLEDINVLCISGVEELDQGLPFTITAEKGVLVRLEKR